jgi:DNA-directed RNA polymerase subunit H (RpoH/RPB5)
MMWEQALDTLKEMLNDRGYSDGLHKLQTSDDIYMVGHKKILVYVCTMEKFNIDSVKYIIYHLQQANMTHGIVIYQNTITSSARKAIEHLQDYILELFEVRELQYNPTRHRLYCPHTRLSKQDLAHELSSIKISSLPVLLRTDVVSRYFRFMKGDIIRVHRHNNSIAYRIVK